MCCHNIKDEDTWTPEASRSLSTRKHSKHPKPPSQGQPGSLTRCLALQSKQERAARNPNRDSNSRAGKGNFKGSVDLCPFPAYTVALEMLSLAANLMVSRRHRHGARTPSWPTSPKPHRCVQFIVSRILLLALLLTIPLSSSNSLSSSSHNPALIIQFVIRILLLALCFHHLLHLIANNAIANAVVTVVRLPKTAPHDHWSPPFAPLLSRADKNFDSNNFMRSFWLSIIFFVASLCSMVSFKKNTTVDMIQILHVI